VAALDLLNNGEFDIHAGTTTIPIRCPTGQARPMPERSKPGPGPDDVLTARDLSEQYGLAPRVAESIVRSLLRQVRAWRCRSAGARCSAKTCSRAGGIVMAKYLLSIFLVCGAAVWFAHSPNSSPAAAEKACSLVSLPSYSSPRFYRTYTSAWNSRRYWQTYAPGWGFGPWHSCVVDK